MPFDFPLPVFLKKAGWKVKIRERETREPPHLTILRRTQAWRVDLRTGEFMDTRPDPNDVPAEIITLIKVPDTWTLICSARDQKYPKNPVHETDAAKAE